jgi:hypothetical protein
VKVFEIEPRLSPVQVGRYVDEMARLMAYRRPFKLRYSYGNGTHLLAEELLIRARQVRAEIQVPIGIGG